MTVWFSQPGTPEAFQARRRAAEHLLLSGRAAQALHLLGGDRPRTGMGADPEPDLRARALYALNRDSETVSVIERSGLTSPPLGLLKAQALMRMGEVQRAEEVLSALVPSTTTERDLVNRLRGECAMAQGREEDGLVLLSGLADPPSWLMEGPTRLQAGLLLYQGGRSREAERVLERLTKDPGPVGAGAAYWSGWCARRRGDERTAAQRFAEAASRGWGNGEAAFLAGVASARGGDPGSARDWMVKLLAASPGHPFRPWALVEKAEAEVSLGEPEAAVATYAELVSLPNPPGGAHVRRAELLMELGRFDEARAELGKAGSGGTREREEAGFQAALLLYRQAAYRRAAAAFQDVAARARDTAALERARYYHGMSLFQAGEPARAADALSRITTTSVLGADVLLARGAAQEQAGRLEAAVTSYRLALEAFPVSRSAPDVVIRLGAALARLGREEEAMETFAAAVERYPLSEGARDLHERVAEYFVTRGRFAEAERLYTVLLAHAPSGSRSEAARLALGRVQFLSGRVRPAGEAFEGLIRSSSSSAVLPEARFRLGDVHLAEGHSDKALALYREVVRFHPDSRWAPEAWARIARLYENRGEPERAAEAWAGLNAEYPDSEAAARRHFELGVARQAAQQYEAAREEFREVARVDREARGAEAQKRIGDCEFSLGRYRESMREYLKVAYLYKEETGLAAEALYRAGLAAEARQDWREAGKQYRRVQETYGETEWAKTAAERVQGLKAEARLKEGW